MYIYTQGSAEKFWLKKNSDIYLFGHILWSGACWKYFNTFSCVCDCVYVCIQIYLHAYRYIIYLFFKTFTLLTWLLQSNSKDWVEENKMHWIEQCLTLDKLDDVTCNCNLEKQTCEKNRKLIVLEKL